MDRRHFLKASAALGGVMALPYSAAAASGPLLTRQIPTTGELVPAIGMGTWITFNVGQSEALRSARRDVLQAFFEEGGGMVDSSPMYGSAQDVLGWCLPRIDPALTKTLISTTKVWTPAGGSGPQQIGDARRLWGLDSIDVMQVHNLVDWPEQLAAIRAARAQGQIRYVGITTSHGSRHAQMEKVMAAEPLDFVQLTYNLLDRKAEARLLPMAADRGIGVIVNRPFQRGALLDRLAGRPLPAWASDYEIRSWPQFVLKFILSHPAVTCAIPATSKVAHMRENMAAMRGPLPDSATRAQMIAYVESL